MPQISKKERDEVSIWRSRIARAKAKRQDSLKIWQRGVEMYCGKHYDSIGDMAGDHVVVNKIFASVRAALPSLIFSRPHFYVRERKAILAQDETGALVDISRDRALAKENWLNYRYKEGNGHFQVRLSVLSSFFALGAVKVGYTPVFQDNKRRGEFDLDEEGNFLMVQDDKTGDIVPALSQGDYMRLDDGSIIYDDDGVPLLEPARIPGKGEYFIEWVPPENFLFDPEGKNDFRQHRWIIEEWVRPLREVRNDPLFKHAKQVQGTEMLGAKPADDNDPNNLKVSTQLFKDGMQAKDSDAVTEDETRVRGYEIWDFEKNEVLVLVESPPTGSDVNDFFLRREKIPQGIEHGPYVFLKFNEVPGRWEPYPDVAAMVPLQEEYNEARTRLLTHARRSDRKYIQLEGTFEDETELDHFKNGGDMSVSTVTNLQGLAPVPMAPMDPANRDHFFVLNNDFNEVAGQGFEQRGVAESESATAASIMESRSQVRENDRRNNIVHDFIRDIGRKMLQAGQVYASEEEWIAIGDPDSQDPWDFQGIINPQMLEGEFEVGIEVGSMLPRTTAVERQQLSQLMVTLAQNPLIMASRFLMDRLFQTFEIRDNRMLDELVQIGQQMLQAEQQTPAGQQGQPNGGPGQQGPDFRQVAERMGRAA